MALSRTVLPSFSKHFVVATTICRSAELHPRSPLRDHHPYLWSGTRELNPDCYAPNVTGSHTPPSLLFGACGGIRTLNIYPLKIARLPIAPHRHKFLQSQLLHPDWIMVLIREPPTSFEEMSSCQRFNELAMNLQGDQIPSNSIVD